MTQRDRLLAPFKGIVPDHPCWTADLTIGTVPRKRAENWKNATARQPGSGSCTWIWTSVFTIHTWESPLKSLDPDVECGTEEKDGVLRRWWRTPAGTLTEQSRLLPESYCWAREEYPVKEPSDFAALRFIFEHRRHEPNYEEFVRSDEFVGESGVPIVAMPRSPLPALLADWCGIEKAIYFLIDMPDLVTEIFSCIDRSSDAAFEILLGSPAVLFHFCDNLDSSASTPFFQDHMREYYQRRLAQVHKAGKYAVVHLDGRVRGLVGKLASCGFDGIEAITPAPVGDVEHRGDAYAGRQ